MLILEHGIRQVDTKHELEQAEAQSNCAILAAEGLERRDVQDLALLPEFSFPRHRVNVVDAVNKETSVATWPGIFQETLLEPV